MSTNIFTQLLSRQCTRSLVEADNRKRALQSLSQLFADYLDGLTLQKILEQLIARERLGSTQIGAGVALPHARIAELKQPTLALITLANPITYETSSNDKVDILCGLLVPVAIAEQHLDILKNIALLLQQPTFCQTLRAANDQDALYSVATTWENEK